MTSHSDILSRLAAAANQGADLSPGDPLAALALTEIERVTKDRDLWRERYDRERAAHAKNLEEQRKAEAERDRYRAALSRIANQSARDYDGPEQEAYASRQIARQVLGEDAKPMPEGARRSQCPACGWTYGTHAPDCESERLRKFT